MWFEFFKFDLRYQLRQPLLWFSAIVLAALAFGASSSDAIQVGGSIGNINRNAPVVIAKMLGSFSIISMFIVTIFIAGSVLRDYDVGISDMIFSTPMRKRDYLIGRFAAGFLACLTIFILIALGMMIGPAMPWVEGSKVGPFSLQPYLFGFAIFVLPNLLFISALLMLLAATTRSMMLVYVGILAFFSLWIVGGNFAQDIRHEWISVLIDPFGIQAFGRAIRYFSPAESNTGLPSIGGFILANRVLWSTVALGLFLATLILFKPQRAGTGRTFFRRKKKTKTVNMPALNPSSVRTKALSLKRVSAMEQCWKVLCFDAKAIFKSIPFLVMLLFAILNFVTSASMSGSRYGTKVYPVTRNMLESLANSYNFMLILIVTLFAGELIFKERHAKLADVTDAMPVPNWVLLVAKCLALAGVILAFLAAGVIAGIAFQLIRGGVPMELDLYAKGILIDSVPFILMGICALTLQVLTNNKFMGYLLVIILMVMQTVMDFLHFDHNLYRFLRTPSMPYSDMNGYGHFVKGWSFFVLYWIFFSLMMLVGAQTFWVRGMSEQWRVRCRLALRRLKGPSGWVLVSCLAGFAGTGLWIFYNTNILNRYAASDKMLDRQAQYEKLYRQYRNLPQLKITDIRADVDIFPEDRRVSIRGHYVLQNKSSVVQDTLLIQVDPDIETSWLDLPAHSVALDDRTLGFKVLKLAQPLAPQARLELNFLADITRKGFINSGAADTINWNGTFFNSSEHFFPHFRYNPPGGEIEDRSERRKRGLGEVERVPKLEDEAARSHNMFGPEADWINFETTISTSSDQIAMAPGYLQKTWEDNGRRYFHYKMDKPMLNFFAFLSARWELRKSDWKGLPIEVYFDKKHAYNVDRMIYGVQKSLDYFSSQFTPYQFQQVRILEFPRYKSFAQSFPNTIPYSESIGFIVDLRDTDAVDYVFYVTAHEMAHQWWGHQVTGAGVQGVSMLSESLAQYSALMVMEKEYGRDRMRRFLQYELDSYLARRRSEKLEEQPLYRVEGQQYIHYEKGSLVFYRLRDEIGEEALNRALKRYLNDKAFQEAPYTTTKELLSYIRAEAPADKQNLITDLFEKIVFYDNRVTEASAKKRADGQWDVTMKMHLAKMEADGKGSETPRNYDEPIELAVFARAPGAKEKDEKVLVTEKRQAPGGDSIVILTVKDKPYEVGVDPYNKMIDRVSADNRMQVTIEQD